MCMRWYVVVVVGCGCGCGCCVVVICGLRFAVCGLWSVVCGLRFVVRGLWLVVVGWWSGGRSVGRLLPILLELRASSFS